MLQVGDRACGLHWRPLALWLNRMSLKIILTKRPRVCEEGGPGSKARLGRSGEPDNWTTNKTWREGVVSHTGFLIFWHCSQFGWRCSQSLANPVPCAHNFDSRHKIDTSAIWVTANDSCCAKKQWGSTMEQKGQCSIIKQSSRRKQHEWHDLQHFPVWNAWKCGWLRKRKHNDFFFWSLFARCMQMNVDSQLGISVDELGSGNWNYSNRRNYPIIYSYIFHSLFTMKSPLVNH